MALPFKIISQDEFTAISLAEAKAQCRVMNSFTMDDDYITSLILVAADFAQEYLHWLTSTGVVKQYSASGGTIQLYGKFIDSVTEITATNSSGDEVPLTEGDHYSFNDITEQVKVDSSYSEIYITYPCGASNLQLPSSVKQGMLMLISTMYNNREDAITGLSVEQMPMVSKDLFKLTRNYVS